MRSRHAIVRYLMSVRPLTVALWRVVPRPCARYLLRLFRNSESALGFGIRYLCLTRLCKACGEKVIVFPSVYLLRLENLELGTNISIHEFCYIDAHGSVRIGDDVAIAHNSSIVSTDHEIDGASGCIKDLRVIPAPVDIGSNVWIGCGARILKGVRVADGSVVAAGAVVTKDVSENTIVAGVPARFVRRRSDQTSATQTASQDKNDIRNRRDAA